MTFLKLKLLFLPIGCHIEAREAIILPQAIATCDMDVAIFSHVFMLVFLIGYESSTLTPHFNSFETFGGCSLVSAILLYPVFKIKVSFSQQGRFNTLKSTTYFLDGEGVSNFISPSQTHLHRFCFGQKRPQPKSPQSDSWLTPHCVAESDRRHAQHPLKMLGIDFS